MALLTGLLAVVVPLAGPPAARTVSYSKDVAPILQAHCQVCHRPGQVGPFALLTYQDARRRRLGIAEVVRDGRMPPWHADPAHGRFANDRGLSPEQKATLLAWIDQDTPEGDPAELPPPRDFPGEWSIGTPDAIFAMPEPYEIKADGTLPYQWFRVPTGLTEDRWVQALEVKPDHRAVVHHILVFIGRGGDSDRPDELGNDQLAGYVPGDEATVFPAGFAKKIPAGADLLFQVHYTPIGKPVRDQSRLAVKFATGDNLRAVRTAAIASRNLQIPPGDPSYETRARLTVPADVTILSLWPHMHLRGKDFRFIARFPDGREEILLSVPRYDFNWQTTYVLAEPRRLPARTVVECVAHFDNSADNPHNPDPDRPVRWGPQTDDEMMIGYIDYVPDDPALALSPRLGGRQSPEERAAAAFNSFDTNNDGRIAADEFDRPAVFRMFDVDNDGHVSREEAVNGFKRFDALRGGNRPRRGGPAP